MYGLCANNIVNDRVRGMRVLKITTITFFTSFIVNIDEIKSSNEFWDTRHRSCRLVIITKL